MEANFSYRAGSLTAEQVKSILSADWSSHEPDIILVGGYSRAIISAANAFLGRDWRRIKREMRKAGDRHRREQRSR